MLYPYGFCNEKLTETYILKKYTGCELSIKTSTYFLN